MATEMENPYLHLSDKERLEKRKELQAAIIQGEGDFALDMELFIESFIAPIMTRDTNFKRSFLSDSSIAVTLNLYKDIYTACSAFSLSLQSATSSEMFSRAFLQFATSLQLFAQYASKNAACLNSLKTFKKQLRDYVKEIEIPEEMTVDGAIFAPLEHYPQYKMQFQELVFLTPEGRPELASFVETLESLKTQTGFVDDALMEAEASIKLFALQSNCKSMFFFTVVHNL
jgi:predicted O-linked N-acetylglucosamine transferase (SPINDLY family)